MDDSRPGPGAQRDASHQGRHDVGLPALDQPACQGQDGQAQVQYLQQCLMQSMLHPGAEHLKYTNIGTSKPWL